MRRLLFRIVVIGVIALAVLFVVGDRLAVQAANHAIAVKARNAAQLAETPSVSIKGFPFLTQAASGRYDKIKITAHGIRRGGVRIDTIHAEFNGVHVSLSDALAGKVSAVPIDKGTGDLLITYADLSEYLKGRSITITPSGNDLSVNARIALAGRTVAASGTYQVGLSGRKLVLSPVGSSLTVDGSPVPAATLAAVTTALTVQIDTGVLPFGLGVTTVHVVPTGLQVVATATGIVVPVPDDAARS
jgi:hypothetical protein